jgi:SAM-dependent methyltransferase
MTATPRWFTTFDAGHSQSYVERFRQLAVEGVDVVGEARLVDAIVAPGSLLLDAGCGPGRVGAELFRRGHRVVGVDVDPVLLAAAIEDHPGPTWVQADLTELDLTSVVGTAVFDAAVLAGNVMPYLAPGTGQQVLTAVARHVRPGGALIVGFNLDLDLDYSVVQFDTDAEAAGLTVELRFATWDVRPWLADSDYAVTVLRTAA